MMVVELLVRGRDARLCSSRTTCTIENTIDTNTTRNTIDTYKQIQMVVDELQVQVRDMGL